MGKLLTLHQNSELMSCICGCGEMIHSINKRGEKAKYKKGHGMRGRKVIHPRFGENAPCWKGDKVGYMGVHKWVREHLPKPKLCEICKKKPPYDLANITGNYNRDFKNWKYLCRSCHMRSDGRMNNLIHQSCEVIPFEETN